jgi:hypothetical protein
MPETVIRIRSEGGSQAKTEIDTAAGSLDKLGSSGGQAAALLGQLGGAGGVVAAALGGAGLAAGVMAGKYALDQFAQSAETAYQAMNKLGGPGGAAINATYGPGGARAAAYQGVSYGVSGEESVRTRAQILGTLGAGDRTEAATIEALRIGRLLGPGQAAQSSQAIGGFMAGNRAMSAGGAGNLYWKAITGGIDAGSLPMIASAAGELEFGTGESMALVELLDKQDINPAAAVDIMRNLRGKSPESRALLKRAGVTSEMGLEERIRRTGALSSRQREQLYGRSLKAMGAVNENLGEFAGLAGEYDAAAGGSTDLVGDYERNVLAKDAMGQQVIGQRVYEAVKEYSKTGKSLAPGQLASMMNPSTAGDIIGAALAGEFKQDPNAYFGGVGAREARDTAAAVAKDDLQRQGK